MKKNGGGNVPRTWILFDSSGQEVYPDVDKYTMVHRLQIHARDVRFLDPQLSYPLAILSRKRAIVVNLEHIKAIITSQEVFLRDPTDEDVEPVVKELRRRLRSAQAFSEQGGNIDSETTGEERDLPFELRALEVALEAICGYLSTCTTELESAIYPSLDMLTSKVSSSNLDRVRKLKSQMTRLTGRVQKLRDELEQILDDDDHMADLYLSRFNTATASDRGSALVGRSQSLRLLDTSNGCSSASVGAAYQNDVQQLEMLLEACFMQMDGTLNRLSRLREYIDSTEGYINIQHESRRNQLIQLELFLTAGSLSLSFYALIAGIFGVSIPYSWNTGHAYLYKWVHLLTGSVSILIFVVIYAYARFKGLV